MAKIPNFAGAEKLSLTDLQALADAVSGQERVLPPAVLSGRIGSRKYSLANFNLETANSCDGSAWPDNEGLIRSLAFSVEDEPYIRKGDIVLPMAHYPETLALGEFATTPEHMEQEIPKAVGVVESISVEKSISVPEILRGQIRLTLADDTDCLSIVTGMVTTVKIDQDAEKPYFEEGNLIMSLADSTECGGAVAGLVQAVEVDVEASEPYVKKGVLYLQPLPPGCTCVPAQYEPGGTGTLGLISSVDPVEGLTAAEIVDGAIRLPYAYDDCHGVAVPGLMRGVRFSSETTAPFIGGGILYLPDYPGSCGGSCSCVPAQYNNADVDDVSGLLASVAADETVTEMMIADGAIKLPMADESLACDARAGLMKNTGQFTESLPTDGCDGWVQSLYLPMQSANGGAQIVSYRQLVRICNGQLQVSAQRCLHPDGNWEVYFSL